VEGEEDKFYYVNEMTKETSWELPKDAAWVLWHDESDLKPRVIRGLSLNGSCTEDIVSTT
jgi:hypothetical protein